jgi:uncharacterized repeat protein (TIGR01451 family)
MMLMLPAQSWSAAICASPGASGAGTPIGIVNTYYQGVIGTLAGGSVTTTLTLGTRDQRGAATAVATGDLLLIIQMQDGSINATNTNAYGDGSTGRGTLTVGSAGLYEFVAVTAVSGTTVTFAPALTNTYVQADATAAAGQKRYQVIRVPQYTTAAASAVTAPPWGIGTGATAETGGVVVMDVADALTLNSGSIESQTNEAIFVGGKGFRGAAGTQSGANGGNTDWAIAAGAYAADGGKGEGIAGLPRYYAVKSMFGAGTTNPATAATLTLSSQTIEGYPTGSKARGAPGNGGGGGTDGNPAGSGGNNENAGGGGGGNFGPGGNGGLPWNAPTVDSRGLGGAGYGPPSGSALAFNRVFFGGGGGSGGTNDGTADAGTYQNQGISCTATSGLCSSGAAGGGIVLIRARSIGGTGLIDARGANGYNVGNDAGGGGGAGGSVVIYAITGGSATINASGGDGGNAWASQDSGQTTPGDSTTQGYKDRHGPGGGGGGGFIAFSPNNLAVTPTYNGGAAGRTTNSASDTYNSASGTGGLSSFQTPNAPGVLPGALCAADLHLAKNDFTADPVSGSSISYTMTATNQGSVATTGTVTVVDALPTGLTIPNGAVTLTGAQSTNWSCSAASNVVTCTSSVSIAASGGASVFAFTVAVNGANGTAVTNRAAIGGANDPNKPAPTATTAQACTGNDVPLGCAVDQDTIFAPSLTLTKSDGTDTVLAGATTTYTMTVANNGAVATSGTIQIADTLPTGMSFTGASPLVTGNFSCTYSAGTLTFICTSATPIASGASSTFTLPVLVAANAPSALTNLAKVGGGNDPGKPTVPTSVSGCPAPVAPATTSSDGASGCAGDTDAVKNVLLTMTKDDGQQTIAVGGQTTYVFTVSNGGSAASTGTINFRDVLPTVGATAMAWPATLTVGGTNGANWACTRADGVTVTCTSTTSIPAGGSSQFSLIAGAGTATAGNQYLNKSRINGGGDATLLGAAPTSTDVGNCTGTNVPVGCATDLDTAQTAAQIRLTKAHSNPQAKSPGDTVAFTLTVSNSGGIAAPTSSVRVIDALPSNLTIAGSATSTAFTCSFTTPNLTCNNTVAALAANSTATITFNATVATSATNSIVNPAQVGTSGTGVDPQNSTYPTTTTAAACTATNVPSLGCAVDPVPLNADLQMAKTQRLGTSGVFASTALSARTGQIVQFQLVTTNAGPATVSGAAISDAIPSQYTGLSIVSATGSTGVVGCTTATITLTGSTLSGTITTLPSAGTCTVIVQGTATTAGAAIANTAAVTAPAGITDTAPANNTSTVTTTIQSPNLSIAKTANTAGSIVTSWNVGQSGATYGLSIGDTGSDSVGTVSVSDILPSGITPNWTGSLAYTDAASHAWSCLASGQAVTCTTASVIANASTAQIVLPVNVTASTSTSATNQASIGGGGDPFNGGSQMPPNGCTDTAASPNHCASVTTTIVPIANLSISKSDGLSSYVPGGSSTYTLTITNAGPSDANGAALSDVLPKGVTLSAVWTCSSATACHGCTVSGASCTGGTIGTGNGTVDVLSGLTVDVPANTAITVTVPVKFSNSAAGYQ